MRTIFRNKHNIWFGSCFYFYQLTIIFFPRENPNMVSYPDDSIGNIYTLQFKILLSDTNLEYIEDFNFY